jgi:TolC family type I secretion outer membrane protein
MTSATRLLVALGVLMPLAAAGATDTPLTGPTVTRDHIADPGGLARFGQQPAARLASGGSAAVPAVAVVAAAPLPDVNSAAGNAPDTANPPTLARRVLAGLRDTGRVLVAGSQQLVIDAWAATREVAADLLPLGMPRSANSATAAALDLPGSANSASAPALGLPGSANSASALALGLAGPSQARSLRLGELPALLAVSPELPLDDGAAASGAASRPLSLQQAIALGVSHSLEVQAADAKLESFRQAALAARGALLPHLDARAAVGHGRLESVSPAEQRARKDGSITLRQSVFDLPATREAQRQNMLTESARLQWQAAVSSASLQVSTSYLQALQARLTLELGSSHERLLGELLSYISQRAEAGGTSIAERDRVKARVANARSQQADARANLRAALRTLATLIGEAPSRLVMAVPDALAVPLDAASALDEARQTNRELVAGRTEAEAAALEARGQRARFLPRLELEVSHNRAVNNGGSESYSRDTKAMLVVNWSLLNGGTDLAQGRAAAARKREKELLADDLERKLEQDLEASYASLDAVADRYSALREELLANRSVVSAFQAQLVGGNRPLLDVLDAYQRLHQSRLDLAQLVLGEVGNHAKVAHITGRLARAGSRP